MARPADDFKITGPWRSFADTSENRLEYAPTDQPGVRAMRASRYPEHWVPMTRIQLGFTCQDLQSGQLDELFRDR